MFLPRISPVSAPRVMESIELVGRGNEGRNVALNWGTITSPSPREQQSFSSLHGSNSKMAVSISRVTFEHHRAALGIHETRPRISWRFAGDATAWEQGSYEIEVRRATDKVSSYSAASSQSTYVSWPGEPLQSAEGASVRVRAHAKKQGDASTEWSGWTDVETGLLDRKDWEGAAPVTTSAEGDVSAPKRPVYFRKVVRLGAVRSARLYITALGIYEAEINGKRVGDTVLAPGWQSYNYRHAYDTYDVTDLLKEGDNVLAVTVGEGWYAGRIGFIENRNVWGHMIGFQSLLKTTLTDGTNVSVPSDASWKASVGPVVDSQIYDGETYDARLEKDLHGWSTSSFDDAKWSPVRQLPSIKGELMANDGPPVRRVEEIRPQRVFKSASGKTIVDMGQNMVGWMRVNSVKGGAGTSITFHHAEVMDNGEVSLRPLRSAKAVDTLILSGGQQSWEPKFTFHGFRFVQIDNWPGELTADCVTGVVIYSDMEATGQFSCSNDLLNKFHRNVIWSMKGNFVSVPTDCPQRDERLGWTGDALAFGPTANFLYDTAGFWRSWHRDVYSEMTRHGDSMRVPYFVPTLPLDSDEDPAAVWGDVAVTGPWDLYQTFGDVDMLREQAVAARGWVDKGIPRADSGLWDRKGHQFGDWLDPKAPPEDAAAAMTRAYLVADAYLVRMTEILGQISAVVGDDAAAKRYQSAHADLRTKFQASWMDENGQMADKTQTAYALALHFDLYTDAKHRALAADALRDLIASNDYLVGTGFAGTPSLGPALEAIDAIPDFYSMLLQTKVPSWLYQVVMGATTTWERWDSLTPDGHVNPGSMTSFNHYAFGTVADWIHRKIGGLAPGEPGWKVVDVAPVPGGGIESADTEFVSPYGKVRVQWNNTESAFVLKLWVPPSSTARVTLPKSGKVKVVGSGYHEFED